MMNYQMFKKWLEENIRDYLPPEMQDASIEFLRVPKINMVKDAISFRTESGIAESAPTIYINDLYQRYLHFEDLDIAVRPFMLGVVNSLIETPHYGQAEISKLNENDIICQLINTKQNEGLLKDVPHREINDLSVVYRWLIDVDDRGMATTLITNDMAQEKGYKEEDLYHYATENMKTLLPTTVRPMREVTAELLGQDFLPEEMGEEGPLFVINNASKHFGASAILDKEALQSLAKHWDSDYYLLPSSIHEFIAIRPNEMPLEELAEMVHDINMTQVELEERLSNQVYFYDKNTQEITQVTNSPYTLEDVSDAEDLGEGETADESEGMTMGGM